MSRTTTLAVASFLSALAMGLCVGTSVEIARRTSLAAETEFVMSHARMAMQRSDRAARQLYSGINQLARLRTGDPCAPEVINAMTQLDLASIDVQSFGYIVDDTMICSSIAGPVWSVASREKIANKDGTTLYHHASIPVVPDHFFTIVEKYGYAAVVHENIAVDIPGMPNGLSLATYSKRTNSIRSSKGFIDPAWVNLALPADQNEATFVTDTHLVTLMESGTFATRTLAARPLAHLKQRTAATMRSLLPFGIVIGCVMVGLIFLVARSQLSLTSQLRRALKRNEIKVEYQPLINLQTRQCVGAEALVRWRRRNGSYVSPAVFIPLAEEHGFISKITQRVIATVTQDAPHILARYPDFHIGINLASSDLETQNTVQLLSKLIHKTGARPGNIMVEATEHGFLNIEAAREVIHCVRELGINVAIDDFGTGYSSLASLSNLDLDYLKIDKVFVDPLARAGTDPHVTTHIIAMAKELKLKLIAEGVETQQQADWLQSNGVQLAQGWLFAKAMPIQQLLHYLSGHTSPESVLPVEQPAVTAKPRRRWLRLLQP